MLGNRPSTIEDDLYPTALVQFGSALSSVAAASSGALPDLSNDSTSTLFEPNKGMCTMQFIQHYYYYTCTFNVICYVQGHT